MPEAELAVVRRANAGFSARDIDLMLSAYAPDAVVVDRSGMGLGEMHGTDELRPYYRGIMDSALALRETYHVVAERPGGVVVTACELWALLPADPRGNGITADYALLFTIAGDRIRRLEIHADAAAALAAAGGA